MNAKSDIESGESAGEKPLDASPEALVRSDTWWINCLRIFLFVTLVLVAIGISLASYKLLGHLEYESFCYEFETVSTRITQAFLQDMKLKMWVSHFVTRSISERSSAGFLDANKNILGEISSGVGDITNWERLGFSPLLWTESSRQSWEANAALKTATQDSGSTSHICHVCGEGMEVGSADNVVNIPTYGSFSCGMVEKAGLGGTVPGPYCPRIVDFIKIPCQCKPTANGTKMETVSSGVTSSKHIFRIKDGERIVENEPPPFSPVFVAWPKPPTAALMYNQMSDPIRFKAMKEMIDHKLPTFSETSYPEGEYQDLMKESNGQPQATIFYPVFANTTESERSVIGSVAVDFRWDFAMGIGDKIPPKSVGVLLVIESSLGQAFSFKISDKQVVSFVGEGDLHDPNYDKMMKGSSFEDLRITIQAASRDSAAEYPDKALVYKIRVYPSAIFKAQFVTRKPTYYALAVAFIFIFTSAIFTAYDLFVRRRQIKIMESAMQSNKIVASVFPDFITSRLMNSSIQQGTRGKGDKPRKRRLSGTPKLQLRTLLGRSNDLEHFVSSHSEPIADFFPNVTVVFADIAGFTAWSSERDPVQVFQLLETVYQSFDKIAVAHGVFKVETIGDCYVAVTGLPTAQPDHAVRMTRFAYDIIVNMHELVSSLESMLGPGTGSLSIRVGLHSGPVTGGVLRGDKARFQLFGDTMNTAARMQTTGHVNKIQASETTVNLLVEAGFQHWAEQRDDKVFVKGKGDLQTFWVDLTTSPKKAENRALCIPSDSLQEDVIVPETNDDSLESLVNWNAHLLEKFLKKVVAARSAAQCRNRRGSMQHEATVCGSSCVWGKPIDDVTEVIKMPTFCEATAQHQVEPESVALDEATRLQLRKYVERIASTYRDNPFHNFEHASHVVMSANKIIKRIIKPEGIDYDQETVKRRDRKKAVAQQIHNSTFGISSDALMQFAVIFSAVIHDVDHTGVSNAQLVKEESEVALEYSNKCVAEQNSIQIAWNLLMEDEFNALRACICSTSEETSRFRQLVVNAVLATDIADAELQTLRKNRWNKAFYEPNEEALRNDDDDISCKATVAFEYIILASDVAHTMQHWHVYNKWNERLFEERYLAFLAGREAKDPSVGWFEGEIWFFDNYIIPMARKLETCGVFGVSSDEYLTYALANRHEWECRGREILDQLKEKYQGSSMEWNAKPNGSDSPCQPKEESIYL